MLVSCILPTKNRAEFIPQAIRCYQSQTYPNKELIIVDNGDDHTQTLIPQDGSIRYIRVGGDQTTGDMRNWCAAEALGEIICHFDSDDWSAPERVTDQVTRLGSQGIVTGYDSMLFHDVRDGQSYQWCWNTSSSIMYALGTSLCYRQAWWREHPFLSMRVGEDAKFFQEAKKAAARFVSTAPAGKLMVARIHNHQTSRKSLTKTSYKPVTYMSLPETFPCGSTSLAI